MSLPRLKKRNKGKKRNQIIHAERAFLERVNMDINENQYTQIINIIKKGKDGIATCIERQSNRFSLWDLKFEGNYIRVVYDNKNIVIVTVWVIPKEQFRVPRKKGVKRGRPSQRRNRTIKRQIG